jgi:Ca2+/Na+ antiporter
MQPGKEGEPDIESDDTMDSPKNDSDGESDDEHRCDHSCGFRCCIPCHPRFRPGRNSTPGCSGCMESVWTWFMFISGAPYVWLFTNTIPHEIRKLWIAFLMNVFWIATLSYIMVVIITRIGCLLGIDTFTMGLVVVAAGTSVPDALSSIIATRDGEADMAVSNAIGSNVFDINLGIGIPYLIKAIADGQYVALVNNDDEKHPRKEGPQYIKFGIILLGILLLCIFSFILSKWYLSKKLGAGFLFLYLCFIAYALIQALQCDKGQDC